MPRMPKYLKREWAFFLDEVELSVEDAFSALAPRVVGAETIGKDKQSQRFPKQIMFGKGSSNEKEVL